MEQNITAKMILTTLKIIKNEKGDGEGGGEKKVLQYIKIIIYLFERQ